MTVTHSAALGRVHGGPGRPAPAPHFPTALGVFRSVEVPSYEERVVDQNRHETERLGAGTLEALLKEGDTWTVSEHGAVS